MTGEKRSDDGPGIPVGFNGMSSPPRAPRTGTEAMRSPRDSRTPTSPTAHLTAGEWALGLWWVLATTVGWVVGFTICEALKDFVESFRSDGAVIGISVGILQWLVLRRHFNRAGWWVLASITGFAVGKALGDALAQADLGAVGLALSGAAIGTSLGIAQWVVLRRHVEQAAWWVLASVAAWAVGWSIIGVVGEAAGGPTGMAYLIGATGAAAAGIITGVALVRLLRQRRA
jgi:hypothetical protein